VQIRSHLVHDDPFSGMNVGNHGLDTFFPFDPVLNSHCTDIYLASLIGWLVNKADLLRVTYFTGTV
jgi:hypothetical protein